MALSVLIIVFWYSIFFCLSCSHLLLNVNLLDITPFLPLYSYSHLPYSSIFLDVVSSSLCALSILLFVFRDRHAVNLYAHLSKACLIILFISSFWSLSRIITPALTFYKWFYTLKGLIEAYQRPHKRTCCPCFIYCKLIIVQGVEWKWCYSSRKEYTQ